MDGSTTVDSTAQPIDTAQPVNGTPLVNGTPVARQAGFAGGVLPELQDGVWLDEVLEGDLIFANRGFWLQRLCDLAGDPWLHVGLAAVVDGQMCIVEVGPDGCGARPLEDIVDGYRVMGVGRLPMSRREGCADDCRQRVVDWARAQVGTPLVYAWDELNLAGFAALFSRILGPSRHRVVGPVARRLASHYEQRPGNHLFCSSFVTAALDQCCDGCRPVVEPFTIGSTVASRLAGDKPKPIEVTSGLQRVFATPTDFWRAADTDRAVLLDCRVAGDEFMISSSERSSWDSAPADKLLAEAVA